MSNVERIMKPPSKCPKCEAEMQEGFVIETKMPLHWLAGRPETKVLGVPVLSIRSSKGSPPRQTVSYRCTACGYLEMYAPDNPL
jgi:hypothetical protein